MTTKIEWVHEVPIQKTTETQRTTVTVVYNDYDWSALSLVIFCVVFPIIDSCVFGITFMNRICIAENMLVSFMLFLALVAFNMFLLMMISN